jgi:acyl-CoA dehydrogenase
MSSPMSSLVDTDAPSDHDLQLVADTCRRFAADSVLPNLAQWEREGRLPLQLHAEAARAGLLGLGYPESVGGTPAPWRLRLAVSRQLAQATGSGGLMASLFTHHIALPPIVAHGSAALQQQVAVPVLAGQQVAALAITEPGGGSDVAALRCEAARDGDHYIVNGEKTFITSGLRAHWITLAVRVVEPGQDKPRGARGVTLLVVPGNAPGLTRTPLAKMGWHCSDTAQLNFHNVRVPVAHRVGAEGAGFPIIMGNFNAERLSMAAMALGFAEACYGEALAWARERKTFGAALVQHQALRHKLMDMRTRIDAGLAWVDALAAQADAFDTAGQAPNGAWVAQVCLLKNHATDAMQFCADAAVQVLGGMGYMQGTVCERVYREAKVMQIGGGSTEIMKDLAAKQLGV